MNEEFDRLKRAVDDATEQVEKFSIQMRFEYESWPWHKKALFRIRDVIKGDAFYFLIGYVPSRLLFHIAFDVPYSLKAAVVDSIAFILLYLIFTNIYKIAWRDTTPRPN